MIFFSIIIYSLWQLTNCLGLIIITILPFSFFEPVIPTVIVIIFFQSHQICIGIFSVVVHLLHHQHQLFSSGAAKKTWFVLKSERRRESNKGKTLIHCSAAAIPKYFFWRLWNIYCWLVSGESLTITKKYNLIIQTKLVPRRLHLWVKWKRLGVLVIYLEKRDQLF